MLQQGLPAQQLLLSPEEQLAELRAFALQQQVHMQQQAAALQQLQHALAQAPPVQAPMQQPPPPPQYAAAPQHRAPTQKIHAEAMYAGTQALEAWVLQMDNLAAFYQVNAGVDMVRFASVHFKGTALQWWAQLQPSPQTWAELKAALHKRFMPITSAEVARSKLRELTQGKRSVVDYVAAFNALMSHVPTMAVEDRVFAFIHGLNKDEQRHVDEVPHSSLESAIERAVRFGTRHGRSTASAAARRDDSEDMQLDHVEGLEHETDDGFGNVAAEPRSNTLHEQMQEMLAYMREQRKGGSSSSSSSGRGGFRPRGRGGLSSHNIRGLPRIAHLSPNQVKEYMDNGKCFGCGSKEHQSRECPNRKDDVSARPSSGK